MKFTNYFFGFLRIMITSLFDMGVILLVYFIGMHGYLVVYSAAYEEFPDHSLLPVIFAFFIVAMLLHVFFTVHKVMVRDLEKLFYQNKSDVKKGGNLSVTDD